MVRVTWLTQVQKGRALRVLRILDSSGAPCCVKLSDGKGSATYTPALIF